MERRSRRTRRDSYDSDAETNNNDNDIMSKADLTRQIEKLTRDLQRRDTELEDEKQESARILERVKKLERDKVELRREVEDFRAEANEYKKALEEIRHKRKPTNEDLKDKYEVTIQQKNHEIQQLLDDLEKLQSEKGDFQSKLNELRDSLEEATTQLENMTQAHMHIKTKLQKSEGKVKEIQDEKIVLEIKVKDLLNSKQRHDQYLENLCSAVDVRVDVWKKMMQQKDEEIDRLNVKLATLANQIPTESLPDLDRNIVNQLKQKLTEREGTITVLQDKLSQATQELESATEHINTLNNRLQYISQGSEGMEVDISIIDGFESKIEKCKFQLDQKDDQISALEKEIEEKSKELTNLAARMHNYETGVYGLAEAIMEIKELKTQLRVRNDHIETMTQDINKLNLQLNDVIDENDMLRSKIDLSATDIRSETKQFVSHRTAEIQALKAKITQLEEQLVSIKTKNYQIRKQLNSNQTEDVSKNIAANFQQDDWKEKYDYILSENLDLRKGLQEILETMQRMSDDAKSDILIESPVLENLLREMSARGLIHYPYGISSFHLKVCNLEGKNSQLREEIHRLKQEEKTNRQELIIAQGTIQSLQDKIVNLSAQSLAVEAGGQPASNDSMVENLQAEVQSLHAQIKHLRDVLQFESSVEKADQCVQTYSFDESGSGHQSQDSGESLPKSGSVETNNRFVQTEEILENIEEVKRQKDALEQRLYQLETDLETLQNKLDDQKIILDAKDKVMNEMKLLNFNKSEDHRNIDSRAYELQEALSISRETVTSLQDRLKSKEDNLNQYRQLLAELRNEMTAATNRHVQEMRALQLTIHQQQQAFTRMKTTLSHPVKDTLNIEGTIKDQLTRIHELEDEVSELQHALGNVASQLTAARSEAHRWRCTAEARLKEVDHNRERETKQPSIANVEEIQNLKQKLKQQEIKISELEAETTRLKCAKDSIQDLVAAIRHEHNIAAANVSQQKSAAATKELQEKLSSKEKEITDLQMTNKDLLHKVTSLQVRISKMNSLNKQTGHSMEMEQLRAKYYNAEQEKLKIEEELKNLVKAKDMEDEKKRKATESMARWEEAKKWKKTVEKLELQIDVLKKDNERLTQINKTLRTNVNRLDKLVSDFKRLQPPVKSILKSPEVTQETVEKLKSEIQDLNDALEKTEFEGKEKIATLEIEIKCLKDRIVSQERQLAAYDVAQKGDPKVVSEIEKLANKESDMQKAINALEEENLHLRLQIEQLRMDTPRLRDRVQQLQKLVEILKSERSEPFLGPRSHSQKSLSELERTITALKQLIDKLQNENKRLKIKPSHPKVISSASNEALKATLENLLAEKKELMNQLATLEEEKEKFRKLYNDANTSVDTLQLRLQDTEKRAKSSEMKLRMFLDGNKKDECNVYERVRILEEALGRKTKLLDEAKLALIQAASSSK